MITNVKSVFLNKFFNNLENQNILYCVLHGYDDLPYWYSGHDLDILINCEDMVATKNIIEILIFELGLKLFRYEERQQLFEYVIFSNDLQIIVLQFLFQLDYRGIVLLDKDEVLENIQYYNGVKVANKHHDIIYAFLCWLFWGNKIKEKYLEALELETENPKVQFYFSNKIGIELQQKLFHYIKIKESFNILKLRKKMLFKFLYGGIKKEPIYLLKSFIRRYYLGVKNSIKHRGKFIVLIGPDGCGKTTISKELFDLSKDLFRDVKYFHYQPRVFLKQSELDNSEILKEKNVNEFSIVFSYLRIIKNFVQFLYFYKNIFYYKLKQNLIIGDRYFYNYFYYPSSVKYSGNFQLVRLLYYFIPKPDYIFFILRAPEEIIKNKRELEISEIEAQHLKIQNLKIKPNILKILNSDKLSAAHEILLRTISTKNV